MRKKPAKFVVYLLFGLAMTAAFAQGMDQVASTDSAARETAACDLPGQPPRALLQDLLGWIAQHSDYDVSAMQSDLPAVTFCKAGEVIDYEGRHMIVDRSLNAAYDELAQRIWLVLPWSADNKRDVSVLLHELVHHVQFRSRSWPCPQASEDQAYQLQHDWLAGHGIASGFNWFAIQMRARCPKDIHP